MRFASVLALIAVVAPLAVSAAFPSYNTKPLSANATGMGSTAAQLAAKIKVGINIGNTLEATGGETAWGNPLITQAYVNAVKAAGFNAVRLPVAWNGHADQTTAKIDATWMARVKTVVNYCVKSGLYVIVNIHWDGGWLEEHCTADKQVANNAKQRAFWEQIAAALQEFDEHVIFASANEPNVDTAAQMTVLLSYHQTFINAVRSTGGHNKYRTLIVQGPRTDIEKTPTLMTKMPTDSAANRMMVEVHYYSPYQFCLMTADADWGKQFYYWGAANHNSADTAHNPTWGEDAYVQSVFSVMKTKFVNKGYPVIIGEFAAMDRKDKLSGNALKLHEASRAYFNKVVVQMARANGMVPFYWDTGSLISRSKNTVTDKQSLTGLMA